MTPDTLRHVPLFESLPDDAARRLCDLLEAVEAKENQTLFRAGDAGNAMYVIESGEIRISIKAEDGNEITVAELGPGEFFGEMSILDGQARAANATAMEPSRLGMLSRRHFLFFLQNNSDVALGMLSALATRLRSTNELLQRRVSRNVNEEQERTLTFADRAADAIAEFGGSWRFIFASLTLFAIWVITNTILLTRRPFDPFPFILLNLALNVITALQAPIIMMSQNRQSHKDRIRADLDYKLNLKNELALNEILQRLHLLEHERIRLTTPQDRQSSLSRQATK
jgi:CRP/FNR family transcriptional regulator, cyclic AMP receptor protein